MSTYDYDKIHTIYMVPLYIPKSIYQGDVSFLSLYKKVMTGIFTYFGVNPGSQMGRDIERVLEMEQEITMESATPRLRHTGERATLEDTVIKSSWKTKCPALTGRSTSTKPS